MSNAASDSTHGSLGGLELLIGEALVGREREGHVALATAHKHIAEQHAAQGGVVARAGGDCNVVRRAATGGRRQRLTPRLRGVGGAQWLKGVSVEGGRHGGARRRVAKNHCALRGALQDHAIASVCESSARESGGGPPPTATPGSDHASCAVASEAAVKVPSSTARITPRCMSCSLPAMVRRRRPGRRQKIRRVPEEKIPRPAWAQLDIVVARYVVELYILVGLLYI
jgi:hypothetical protein